jgi:hypothetical protein
VPQSVTIPANQTSASFSILGVHDTSQGTTRVTITAAAAGYTAGTQSLLVADSDLTWHNAARPADVNNDGTIAAIDALLIINQLNAFGAGPVPPGNPPPFLDVNADNAVSPIDALTVINVLNSQSTTQGEGEADIAQTGGALRSRVGAKPATSAVDDFFAALAEQGEVRVLRKSR